MLPFTKENSFNKTDLIKKCRPLCSQLIILVINRVCIQISETLIVNELSAVISVLDAAIINLNEDTAYHTTRLISIIRISNEQLTIIIVIHFHMQG